MLSVALIGQTACTTPFEETARTCEADADCPFGQGCAENLGVCLDECSTYADCPNPGYRCEGGLCFEVNDAECRADDECDEPGTCENSKWAQCVEGQCQYTAVVCDDPPPRECINDDSTVRVYAQTGLCDPDTGECVYDYTDIPCAECSVNCLENDPCEGVDCPDENGGCRTNGVCLPTNPPTCQYENAPINTPCDREGSSVGALDGFCNDGVCGNKVEVSCTANDECAPDTCIDEYCQPTAALYGTCDNGDDGDCQSGLECVQQTCMKADGQTCGANTECTHTCISDRCAPPSADSGPCDSTNGGDDDDCESGLFCNDGICEPSPSCTSNSECGGIDTCIGGYCRAPATTGGTCDPGDDADCLNNHDCVSGICLRVDGQSCANNIECVNVCISGNCTPPSTTGGPCDDLDPQDCESGNTCTNGACLLQDGQSGCNADTDCVHTCIAGICGPRVGAGEACDSPGDCSGGLQCTGGFCRLQNGESCNANTECVQVCINTMCAAPSDTLGSCDTADGDDDCSGDNVCDDGVCRLPIGLSCNDNNECLDTCISNMCAPVATTTGYCDPGDNADCEANHLCVSNSCLLDYGQICSNNAECVEVCIDGACDTPSDSGGICDEHADCASGLPCVSGNCRPNGIWRIKVSGSSAGGGGGNDLSGWRFVDYIGGYLDDISSGTNKSLYYEIEWTTSLTSRITAGHYFALEGNEGSADVSRTFTFYDGFGVQVDALSVGPISTGWMVRTFSSTADYWVRFHYDGSSVSYTLIHPPIATIVVEGTSTSYGGGSPLSGYYEVDNNGANQGQLSSGASQALYALSSWEVDLTEYIYDEMRFALVGSESSEAVARTFTFKASNGVTLDTVTIENSDTADIVRYSGWSSNDTYILFTYSAGEVDAAEAISN